MINVLKIVGCLFGVLVVLPALTYLAWLALMYQMGRK